MKFITANRITATILLMAGIYFSGTVLVPLFLSIIVALLLDPIVVFMESKKVSRIWGTTLTLITFIVAAVLSSVIVYRASSRAVEQAPQYLAKLKELTSSIAPSSSAVQSNGVDLGGLASSWDISKLNLVDTASSWGMILLHMVGSVFELISLMLFVPLLIFYFLADKSNLVESFNTLAGKALYLPKFNSDLPRMIRAFFVGNLVGGLILVALHLIVFLALGLHNSVGLAFISGFLNLIPLVGAPLALVLPLAQGVGQWQHSLPFIEMALCVVALHFIVGNVVLPQLIGARINVNHSSLVIGLLFWGWIWGPMGFLLAIPLTATLKILLECNQTTRSIANLLAARPRHVQFNSKKRPEKMHSNNSSLSH